MSLGSRTLVVDQLTSLIETKTEEGCSNCYASLEIDRAFCTLDEVAHPEFWNARVMAHTAKVMNEVDLLNRSGFDGAIAKPIDQIVFPDLLNQILDGEEVWNIF